MITGIHVVSDKVRTEPRKSWEILLQIASLKLYQNNFGPIHLYCCEEAHDFYESIGVLQMYDEVHKLDESLIEGVDQKKYFATSKLLAQLQCDLEECIFIDTDLLITNAYAESFLAEEVCGFFHEETTDVYSHNSKLAINCAFNLWKNKEIRRSYASEALRMLWDDRYSMIDVEQASLGLFLLDRGISYGLYIENIWDTRRNQFIRKEEDNLENIMDSLNHLWGEKRNIREEPLRAADLTIELIRLLEEFEGINVNSILEKI